MGIYEQRCKALAKDRAALENRIAVLERLCLKLLLTEEVDQTTTERSSILPPRTTTVKEAVFQALKEGERSMRVHEIRVIVERLTQREVPKSTIRQYLSRGVQASRVKRIARDLYAYNY